MPFLQRLKKKLAKHGEQFTVGANSYRGVFQILNSGTMSTYLDDVERMGVIRPGLLLVTQGDALIAVNDTITRDSRTYTVLKTSNHRIGDATVVKIAVIA